MTIKEQFSTKLLPCAFFFVKLQFFLCIKPTVYFDEEKRWYKPKFLRPQNSENFELTYRLYRQGGGVV